LASQEQVRLESASRTLEKEAQARMLATQKTPQLSDLSRVHVRLQVTVVPGAGIRKVPLAKLETIVAKSLGGEDHGVLAVMLNADASGQAHLNGECTVWVGDIGGRGRPLCKSLEKRLQEGTAAVYDDTFEKLACRGKVQRYELQDRVDVPLSAEQVALTIRRALPELRNKSIVLSAKLRNGRPTPWSTATASSDISLDELGPKIAVAADICDVRDIVPSGAQSPTLQLLCSALRILTDEGTLSIYRDTLEGRDVMVFRSAVHDDWVEDGGAMQQA
jgi:hypothetical protein